MPSKPTPDHFLNIKQVADLIGVSWTTIRDGKCGTGEIPRIKIGRRVLFSFNAVQAWMSRKVEEARQDQERQKATVRNLLAGKDQIRAEINKTYLTIINGGKYR